MLIAQWPGFVTEQRHFSVLEMVYSPNMLGTDLAGTAPTITALIQYPGTALRLDNGYNNIVLSSFTRYGGSIVMDGDQSLIAT